MELAQSSTLQTHSCGDTARSEVPSCPPLYLVDSLEQGRMCLFQRGSSEARVWLAVVFLAFRQLPGGGGTTTSQHGCLFSRPSPFLTLSPGRRCFQLCGSEHQIGQGASAGQWTLRLPPQSLWGGEGSTGCWGLCSDGRPSAPWSSSVHRHSLLLY